MSQEERSDLPRQNRDRLSGRLSHPIQKSGGAWTVAAFIEFRPSDYKVKHVKKKILLRGGGFISFAAFRTVVEGMKRNSECRLTSEHVILQGRRDTKAVDVGEASTSFSIDVHIEYMTHAGEARETDCVMSNEVIQQIARYIKKVESDLDDFDGYDPINTRDLAVNTYEDDDYVDDNA